MAQHFGLILRNWRKEAGFSLRRLASKAEISFTYLSKIERGELPPPTESVLLRLAEQLGRRPQQVMDLAKRLSSDIIRIAQRHPSHYEALLRMTKKLSAQELDRIIAVVRQELISISRERRAEVAEKERSEPQKNSR